MTSSSNQEQNNDNDDEGSWQKREVFRAVASALANNLVTALIALALAIFAFVRIDIGQWMHAACVHGGMGRRCLCINAPLCACQALEVPEWSASH